ncbi:MAG: glycosyltransferase family 2 protein [Pirellulales bacterium]
MDDSLSIILPVHNGQGKLVPEVEHLLEVVPELTSRFDVLIVDDGSRDGTEEIARDLTAHYAQLHYVRHPLRLGPHETIHTALSRTDGDYLLVREATAWLRADALPRLWARRDDAQNAHAGAVATGGLPAEASTRIGWLDRLLKWGHALRESSPGEWIESGLRLYRRDALAALALREASATDSYIEHLRHTMHRRPAAAAEGEAAGPREHVVPPPKSVPAPIPSASTPLPAGYIPTR